MNNNAKKWVEALRSGKYKQGQHLLRNEKDEFCCLGVACEVYVASNPDAHKAVLDPDDQYSYLYRDSSGQDHSATLSDEVREWLGLTAPDGSYVASSLINLNDTERYDFDQIADVIESEPKGLFRGAS